MVDSKYRGIEVSPCKSHQIFPSIESDQDKRKFVSFGPLGAGRIPGSE